jgi:hypothetical protein
MPMFEFESGTFPWFCHITFVRMENRVCLSRGVQVAGATWRAATKIVAGVGDQCRGPGMVKHRSGTHWPGDQEVG